MPSFKKHLIVEQFQGNYRKYNEKHLIQHWMLFSTHQIWETFEFVGISHLCPGLKASIVYLLLHIWQSELFDIFISLHN